ncbi:MAG: hypothetical protein NXH82_16155 [Rhodobacteraceae bacterium]|nr:hypothetical protein [Paracoccaceae bacterium]
MNNLPDPTVPATSNDYHLLPVSEKQLSFARQIAARTSRELPDDVLLDRTRLSRWIDQHKDKRPGGRFANYPSSKQVAFAERIARQKRQAVPQACFRDRALMSRWIDSNL